MIMRLKVALRNSIGQLIVSAMDAGSGPGTIEFYDGAMPVGGPATAVGAQVLLGVLVCSDPSASVEDGIITFSAVTQDSAANAGGIASWARVKDSDGNAVADYDVTNEAGSGAIKVNTTTIFAGGPIQMVSFTITVGGA